MDPGRASVGGVAILLALLLLAPLLPCAPLASAGEPPGPPADAGARLRDLLGSGSRGGNTIPIEQEILRLRDERSAEALVGSVGHERWGPIVLWALAGIAGEAEEATLLDAFARMPVPQRVGSATALAQRQSAKVREALRALLGEVGAEEGARQTVHAALLRAGDEATRGEVDAALAGSDVAAIVRALLCAGEARAAEYLPAAAALAGDLRPVTPPVRSAFGVRTRTEIPGGFREETAYPDLATLGAVALEAANRIVGPDTPGMIAWWYEIEETPRFGAGEDGARHLAAYVAEDRKAAEAGALRAETAIRQVLEHLRRTRGGEGGKVRVTEVAFDGAWTIAGTADGGPWRASVSAKGEVTAR
jgi:hypothetical protein